jgi:hypothetical protein
VAWKLGAPSQLAAGTARRFGTPDTAVRDTTPDPSLTATLETPRRAGANEGVCGVPVGDGLLRTDHRPEGRAAA